MNIWALEKDISIKHLLILLTDDFGENVFRIINSAHESDCAIRLANAIHPDVMTYIYTYAQAEGRYGIHIEYPNLPETAYRDTMNILDNVDYDELRDVVQTSLDLTLLQINTLQL